MMLVSQVFLLPFLAILGQVETFSWGHQKQTRYSTRLHASTRRDALVNILSVAATGVAPKAVLAAETIGKAADCNDSTCLGVWDGLLADCPHDNLGVSTKLLKAGAGCVCSQDDTPGIFSEP
jgi:hypothetical protein